MRKIDLLLKNCRILNKPYPVSISIDKGRITSFKEAEARESIDLKGKFLTPGFVDSHIHLLEGSLSLLELNLKGQTLRGIEEKVSERAKKKSGWIIGKGWENDKLEGKPEASVLDRASPSSPVALWSRDLHTLWLNSEAMKRLGTYGDGILREEKAWRVKIPEPDESEIREALRKAEEKLLSLGVTAVVDFSGERAIKYYGENRLKIYLSPFQTEGLEAALRIKKWVRDSGKENLKLGPVKFFEDGSFGSRTAALKEEYIGGGNGLLNFGKKELEREAFKYRSFGFKIAIHAIGDKAFEIAYKVAKKSGGRIEHIQLLPEGFSESGEGIYASLQPSHIIEDQTFLPELIGRERERRSYPIKTLRDLGFTLIFGSDWPVEEPDPRKNLYAATSREWNKEDRVSIEEAIISHTEKPAEYLGGKFGKIREGMEADLVVWEEDFRELDGRKILQNKVVMTILGGKSLYLSS